MRRYYGTMTLFDCVKGGQPRSTRHYARLGVSQMGEWTWLHVLFPSADIALTRYPIPPKVANVIVRTCRRIDDDQGSVCYQLRVAPHNVAPFRGGPWTRVFLANDLETPGLALDDFREKLAAAIRAVYPSGF